MIMTLHKSIIADPLLMAKFADVKLGLDKLNEAELTKQEGHKLIHDYFTDKVEEYGVTEFAARCGKSKQYINNIRSGSSTVSPYKLVKLLEQVTREKFSEKS
jgi:transcriptional regulator with XRE-family HTH domain